MQKMLLDYENVVYLNCNFVFDRFLSPLIIQSLKEYRHITSSRSGDLIMDAVKGPSDFVTKAKDIDYKELFAEKTNRDPNLRCYILQSIDVTKAIHLQNLTRLMFDESSIVLGVPVTSKRVTKFEDLPLLKILLPSLRGCVHRNSDMNFTLLVAYDTNDKLYDNSDLTAQLQKLLSEFKEENLKIYLVRIVRLGSVSMIWNILYELAMSRGARYFFQVNDDLRFHTCDWPSRFKTSIDSRNGHGVVGPADAKFGCQLMTQNFVGRGHYETFGFLFPPDIRNWWCDNWLNRMYEGLGMKSCFPEVVAANGGRSDGPRPRYQACRTFDYTPYLHYHLQKTQEKKNF